MRDAPEEIDMSEAGHVAWVKAQRDPALWHQAAMAALAYRGDDHGFLHWLLEQPEMDRATAGWIFCGRKDRSNCAARPTSPSTIYPARG